MSSALPRIVMLSPGPRYDLEWEFGVRLEGMSRFSEGYVITTSHPPRSIRVGNYDVITTLFWPETWVTLLRSRLNFFWRSIQTMRRAKREGKRVDLVVAYDPLLTAGVGWVLSVMYGTKLICEVNGDYADDVNFLHVKQKWLRVTKKWIALRLARFCLGRAAGIRLLHENQLRRLDYELRSGQLVEQIPEFVDAQAFSNLGEEKIVLLVGFPFFVKGVDIAIAAFKRVLDDFPDWTLVIMGYYPDSEELSAALKGCPNIRHQPAVLHRKMPQYIGRCAILLQPSRTEAMGRVLVEAMAAGKPRIASDVGGIATVIDDQVDGMLIESENIDAFAKALSLLMGSEQLRRKLGDAGARRAATELSVDSYMSRTKAFYGVVLGKD